MLTIITDSTSDLTPAEAESLGVTVVPLTVSIDGKEYRDGIDLTSEEFFTKLDGCTEIPTTSQAPAGKGCFADGERPRRSGNPYQGRRGLILSSARDRTLAAGARQRGVHSIEGQRQR